MCRSSSILRKGVVMTTEPIRLATANVHTALQKTVEREPGFPAKYAGLMRALVELFNLFNIRM